MADFRDIWSPAKVFSPSTAKQQSLQAKDWSYVDHWLHTRFHPNPVPKFERNTETLKALLTLASANEAADEERALEKRVKEKALEELQKRDAAFAENISRRGDALGIGIGTGEEPVLVALEESLTAEGGRALGSVALLSVALGCKDTATETIMGDVINLMKEEFLLQQQQLKVASAQQQLEHQLEELREYMKKLDRSGSLAIPPELQAHMAEWARASRHLKNKTEDYKERIQTLEAEFNSTRVAAGLTVHSLADQETAVLALKEHVLTLEAQARGFQGLPPEKDLARFEVERVEQELEALEARREILYDMMVAR
ncbi:hypothetical protein RUND412_003802 [Rhizina undulata]